MHFCCGENMRLGVSSIRRFSEDRDKDSLAEKVVKLAQQPALGVDMGDVGEITVSRGGELTDKELIQFEESEVSAETEAWASEELQDRRNYSQQTVH